MWDKSFRCGMIRSILRQLVFFQMLLCCPSHTLHSITEPLRQSADIFLTFLLNKEAIILSDFINLLHAIKMLCSCFLF